MFVDVLGFTVVIPLLPFYAERFGATPATVGQLFSVYAICALIAAPVLGRCSDRWGRKPVLLLSQLGSLLGFVLLALAPSLPWLFAARALDGATAANILTARAYIADVTPPKQRSAAFGLIATAFSFGYVIGPAGAALLAQWGPRLPLWTAAALAAISLLCTLFLLPSGRPPRPAADATASSTPLLREPGVAPRLWQLGCFFLAFSMFTAGIALFCERRLRWNGVAFGISEVGWLLAWIGLLGLCVQLLALRRLLAQLGEPRLIGWCLAIAALGYAGLGLSHELMLLMACLSLVALANSALRPALLGLLSQGVSAARQGQVFGVTQSLQSLAMIAGPLIAGGLIEQGWLTGWALACAATLLLALGLSGQRAGAGPSTHSERASDTSATAP